MKNLLASLSLLTLQCASAQTTVTNDDFAAALMAAHADWEQAAIGDYVYGFNKFCDCHRETPPETLVEVRGGSITDVRHVMFKTGDTVAAEAENFDLYWTIDDLFSLLERAVQREVIVRADFDAELGLPRRIFIDYLPDIVGDELDVRITRFEDR